MGEDWTARGRRRIPPTPEGRGHPMPILVTRTKGAKGAQHAQIQISTLGDTGRVR